VFPITGNTDCVTVGIAVIAISNRLLLVQPKQPEGQRGLGFQQLAVQVWPRLDYWQLEWLLMVQLVLA
jgi:hypothetical protein